MNIVTILPVTQAKNLNVISESFFLILYIQSIAMFSFIYFLNHVLNWGTLLFHLDLSTWLNMASGAPVIASKSQASSSRNGQKKGMPLPLRKCPYTLLFAFHWPKLNHKTMASFIINWKLWVWCLVFFVVFCFFSWVHATLIKIRVLVSFLPQKFSFKIIKRNQAR